MSTFKEIDINEYKNFLDNVQHTYAKNLIILNYYITMKEM